MKQPKALQDALQGRVASEGTQEGIFGAGFEDQVKDVTNIQIVACGTSFHAGRIFEFWSHKFLGVNCRVDYGSEYQYQEPIKTDKTLFSYHLSVRGNGRYVIFTKFAKKTGKPVTLTICNVANSSMCRESDFSLLTNVAGP